MEYQRTYQDPQPYGSIHISQLDPAYAAGLQGYESHNFLSTFPLHQRSQLSINPISNSSSSDNFVEGFTWPAQDNALGLSTAVLVDPLLQIQPAVPLQSDVTEHSNDEQDWRQAVARLEDRLGGLEVVIKSLTNDIEEKTRFFADVGTYIKQLVDWTKDSKLAIDSLVVELKEAVNSK